FYLNSHMTMAAWTLIAVAGGWLAVVHRDRAWAAPAGLALGATVLMRAESPVAAVLLLVPFAATAADRAMRWMMALPIGAITVTWYWWVSGFWHVPTRPVPLEVLGSVGAVL